MKAFDIIPQRTFYDRLVQDIEGAQKSIDVHFYIAKRDKTTQPIFEAIKRAAQRNVEVRFVTDSVFSYFPLFDRSVTSAGKAIKEINQQLSEGTPIQYRHSRQKRDHLNPLRRNHKKIVIVDSGTPQMHGWVGGSNLADKYAPWRDSMTAVGDEVAAALEIDFNRTWRGENKGFQSYQVGRPEDHTEILSDSKGTEQINQRVATEIDRAQQTIWIETAYLRGPTVRNALLRARQRNPHIDIRLLVPYPSTSNDSFYKSASLIWLRPFVKQGIPVYLYGRENDQFTHAKAIITDDTAIVGSSNFVDGVVVGGNDELVMISKNPEFYKNTKEWIESGFANAERYRRGGLLFWKAQVEPIS